MSGLINQTKYWQAVMLACEMGTQSCVCRERTHKHIHTLSCLRRQLANSMI